MSKLKQLALYAAIICAMAGVANAERIIQYSPGSGPGGGDLVGPSSSVDGTIFVANGTSGKTARTSPVTISSGGQIAAASDLLIGVAQGASSQSNLAGTLVDLQGATSTNATLALTSWDAISRINVRRAEGTAAATTATLSGTNMFQLNALGHDGTTWVTSPAGGIVFQAAGTWSPTSTPMHMFFRTTPVGTAGTATIGMGLSSAGNVAIGKGQTAASARLEVAGSTSDGTTNVAQWSDSSLASVGIINTDGAASFLSGLSVGSVSPVTTPGFATFSYSNSETTPGMSLTQGGAGDAALQFVRGSSRAYAMGLDQSDSDSFVISSNGSSGAILGTGNIFKISSSGTITPASGATFDGRDISADLDQAVKTTSVPTFGGAAFSYSSNSTTPLVSNTNSSSGDAAQSFILTGGTSYAIGIDNSASDAFVLSYNAAGAPVLGTSNLISVTTAGAVTIAGALSVGSSSSVLSDSAGTLTVNGIDALDATSGASIEKAIRLPLCVAISDETTAITTGVAKVTMRAPFAFTLTAVRASLGTVSSSGIPTVDINEGGTTVLSTKLTIDASEKTSTTAATAAVISDSAIADDAELTFDIDVAGTGAAGLKVCLFIQRT